MALSQRLLRWTPGRCRLELSLLTFAGSFHTLYCKYRRDAEEINAALSEIDAAEKRLAARAKGAGAGVGSAPSPRTSASGAGRLSNAGQTMYMVSGNGIVPVRVFPSSPGGGNGMAGEDAEAMMGVFGDDDGNRLSDIPPLMLEQLRLEAREKSQRNLLLVLLPFVGTSQPFELLDVLAAKTLDNLRVTDAVPTNVVAASLRTLHELAMGVTVVTERLGPLALQQAVSVGDDLLRTVCVRSLLKNPALLNFPPLTRPRHFRFRSSLYATVTRLLFLNAKAVTAPNKSLLSLVGRGADGSVSSAGPGSGRGKQKAGKGDEDGGDKDKDDDNDEDIGDGAYVFSAEAGPSGWFSSFVAPLSGTIASLREALGLSRIPPAGPYRAGADAPLMSSHAPLHPGDPRLEALKPSVIGLLRDLRGVLSASSSSNEYRLVHDFLTATGAHELFFRIAVSYRPPATRGGGGAGMGSVSSSIEVLVPLMRLLAEYSSNRNHRIIFPPGVPSGYVVFREIARTVVAVATHMLASACFQPDDAGRLKVFSLCLGTSFFLLTGRFANPGLMAAYGDSTPSDLWHAAVQVVLTVPVRAFDMRPKVAAGAFLAMGAVLQAPIPPPPEARGSSRPRIVAPDGSPSNAAHPATVAAFMRLPSPVFLGFARRLAKCIRPAGLGTSATAGKDSSVYQALGLNAVEALLSVEAEARLLTTTLPEMRPQPGPNRLVTLPSGMRMTPNEAADLVARMDAHISASGGLLAGAGDDDIDAGTGGEGAGAGAGAGSGDMTAPLRAAIADMMISDATGNVAMDTAGNGGSGMGSAFSSSSSASSSSAAASTSRLSASTDRLFGASFTANAMLAAIRTASLRNEAAIHAVWALGSIVLFNTVSRPSTFSEAASLLLQSCAAHVAKDVEEANGALRAAIETIPAPTSSEGKDEFCSLFGKWARTLAGHF